MYRTRLLTIVIVLSHCLTHGLALNAYAEEPPRLARTTQIQDGAPLGVGKQTPDLTFKSLTDKRHKTSQLIGERKGLVYVMTSTGCPLSRKYAPRIASIEKSYADDFAFVYVNTVRAETQDDMRRQIRENGFAGPYIPDRGRTVVSALGARTTTEIFVIDAARTLIYRGAVDDQYGVGTSLSEPRRRFLIDALDAVKAGKRPSVHATFPPGCLLDVETTAQAPEKDLTYHGRISRIIAENCLDCHRLGGAAPFTLDSYSALLGRLSMIDAVVSDRIMPPWHGDRPTKGDDSIWANDRAMSDEDREDLVAWLRSNRPLGLSSDSPVAPTIPNTWEIGRADKILSTIRLDLPETGPMQYERMIVPTNFKEDRWVSAIEFRQDGHEALHHALIWILSPGATLPAVDKIPGELELLGSYSPGDQIIQYDEGIARQIPAGSLLLIDLYARPMDLAIESRLRVGFRFARTEPTHQVRTLVVAQNDLTIPANTADATVSLEAVLSTDTTLLAIMPYLRTRGSAVTIDMDIPGEGIRRLLNATQYDYRWQIRYVFKEPLKVAADTRFIVRGEYDNSAENPNNPDATKEIHAGVRADDEALMIAVDVVEPIDRAE